MAIHLYLAPAAAGKTAYLVSLTRHAAHGLDATPRVVVPTMLQVRSWRHRLAQAGGAIGVRVLTFSRLYAECLTAAGESYTELAEPVQYRLIRSIVDGLHLVHYAPLIRMPGFVQVLQRLIGDLKAAGIYPDAFAAALSGMGSEPRLAELALVYSAYQERLREKGWADAAGMGWLAAEAARERFPALARDWPLLVVDGFDSLTSVQLSLLSVLAGRVGTTLVALTGTLDGSRRPAVHSRFRRTLDRLEEALGVRAEPLPQLASRHHPALAHLEAALFEPSSGQCDAGGALEMIEAPDRAAEVRAALRWLKARLCSDGMRPEELALLARDIAPYRPFLLQAAAEFGLPIRLVGGLPLASNPAVAALLDLLRLVLPAGPGRPEPALPRRALVEAWRSPYFDWSALPSEGAPEPVGISPDDAERLAAAGRWGRVIGGLSQWVPALQNLACMPEPGEEGAEPEDEDRSLPRGLVRGARAAELLARFERFVQRLTPLAGEHPYRDHVAWLEDLVGPDPESGLRRFPDRHEPTALQIVAQARSASPPVAERDVAALRALKDILRGLAWAEDAVGSSGPAPFDGFLSELIGAVEAASYTLPAHPERGEIVVADVVQARGVPLRAAALLGLAEGEFPRTISEDPFLRDADRQRLSEALGIPLDPSTASAEAEFFYEAVTRPRERLLLTRPRLADNGAPWQASPFWEEGVRAVLSVEPATLVGEGAPPPDQAASWPELLESLAAHPGREEVEGWLQAAAPARHDALQHAAAVHRARAPRAQPGRYDGDLPELGDALAQQFGPGYLWSATGLETYRLCPFAFFAARLLRLEERVEPEEGLNAAQLGTIYHQVLERVHRAAAQAGPAGLEQLLAALPGVAAAVLDAAPGQLGFRETAWWPQTRAEIEENVRRSLVALADLAEGYLPYLQEAAFGMQGAPPLRAGRGDDAFLLRGMIDRIDRAPGGGIRVVDYKSGGKESHKKADVAKGKKLQLPLYALAAREALGLGEPEEGFYFHIKQAEASDFRLSRFEGGPEGAMNLAVDMACAAIAGVRGGHFRPLRPDDGCPSYCLAAAFCWHYRPGYGG